MIFTVTLCLFSVIAWGQTFNQAQAMQEISNAAASLTTMQCHFKQTKSLKMLGNKMVSNGFMYCEQPNKLRWEYVSPYTYTFILNDNKVLLRKGARNDVIDVRQNKMFKEIARIMMNSVLGKCLTDTKEFKVGIVQEGECYIATLIPLKKEMKQMFTNIVLHYDKKISMVTEVTLHERNGDFTNIELKEIQKNASIDAATFKIN